MEEEGEQRLAEAAAELPHWEGGEERPTGRELQTGLAREPVREPVVPAHHSTAGRGQHS